MHFLFSCSLFWDREELTTQHTPLALQGDDLTCTCTQMWWGGDLRENTQATVNVREASGDGAAVIVWLLGEVGRVIVGMQWYELRNVGRA